MSILLIVCTSKRVHSVGSILFTVCTSKRVYSVAKTGE